MTNPLFKITITSSILFIAVFLYGTFGGYVSNFKIVLNIEEENRSAEIVAHRGIVTGLHVQYNEDGTVLSEWRIHARQLMFGHQWIRLWETRELIYGGQSDDYVSRENLLSQSLSIRFGRIDRVGDTIYLWENYPVPTLYKGQVEGTINLHEYIISMQKTYADSTFD
ncbi:hypothetical protein [Vibrio profundi]|uniref:hypothetical protein n=1 Tax=Vibrio profundi TaxID=1774960 RepID=UPI0037354996